MAIHSAKLGNYDTLATWGLYMKVGSPNIGEPEPDETGCPKSEVERLIERINAIQSELPAHRAVYYEDEKAFSDAAEEHYAALYRALPSERRKR